MRRRPETIPRFTRTETLVHRTTAALFAIVVVTAAVLYDESLALIVGRRPIVEGIHIIAGLLLPVPTLIGLARSRELRADLRSLGRFGPIDRQWLRRTDRRVAKLAVGKFNGGQKLASAIVLGLTAVLFVTGLLLVAPARIELPVRIRQGATITHDLFTFALLILLAGHIWEAVRHPEARAALRTGSVDRAYAEREHRAWARAQLAATSAAVDPD